MSTVHTAKTTSILNIITKGFTLLTQRAKGPVRRAFLFVATTSLLLVGQSATFPLFVHAADDPGYIQAINNESFGYQWDPWGFAARNCTSYVAYRVSQTGITLHGLTFRDGWGVATNGLTKWDNAQSWANYAIGLGFKVDGNPAVGSVAQWNANESSQGVTAGSVGHVAYVTAVSGDGSVTIQDYNRFGDGQYNSTSGVKAPRYIHLERSLPGGWWQGPSPSPNATLSSGQTINLGAHLVDNGNGGLMSGNFTIYNPTTDNNWHLLKSTQLSGVGSADISATYTLPSGTNYIRVSFDVYSNTAYTSPSVFQLSPSGVRQYCVTGGNSCPTLTADDIYNDWTVSGGYGGGSASCSPVPNQVVLFTGTNYGGTCQSFGIGNVNDLSTYGLSNDVQSIGVPSSMTLFTYTGKNLTGTPGVWNNNVPDLSVSQSSNVFESIKIEATHNTSCNNSTNQNGILLFRNANFDPGGGCTLLTSSNPDLNASVDMAAGNSLEFLGSYTNTYQATFYTGTNYTGTQCGNFYLNSSYMGNCDGQTASVQIAPFTPPQQANNIAPSAQRDHPGSDAVVDNNLATEWIPGHATPIGFVFAQPQTIQDVVVFDRAQSTTDNNQINNIELVFSDGTVINQIDMGSGGPRCADVSFPAKTVTWVNVYPYDSSGNNGYKEVQIWDTNGSVYSQNNCVNKKSLSAVSGVGPSPLFQNIAPVVMSTTYTTQEGVTSSVQIGAQAANNTPVTLSATNLPSFASFTDNGNNTGNISLNPPVGSAGTYLITVTATTGTITGSGIETIVVNPQAPTTTPCETNWTCTDISNDGSQSPVTTYNAATGTWTTQGSGSDIWGTADHFHYNYLPLNGDGYISAELMSQTNSNGWAKTGPMIRNSTASNAAFYFPQMTPSNGISVQYRTADGATASSIDGYTPPYPLPFYLKASRSGNQYSSYISQNGTNWTLIPNSTVAISGIGTNALQGLAVTSHDGSQISTAVYTNVLTGVPAPPPPSSCNTGWTCEDISNDGVTGLTTTYQASTGTWTTQGSGSDIWNTADHFHFNDTPISGDGGISARVVSQSNTSDWAKSGVMIRDSNASNAAYYSAAITNGHGVTIQYRSSAGAQAQDAVDTSASAPIYLKVLRSGTSYTSYSSTNGTTWTLISGSTQTISGIRASGAIEGVFTTSHNTGAVNTATFDSVSLIQALAPPPPPPSSLVFEDFKNGIGAWWQGGGPVALASSNGTNFLRFTPASGSSAESNKAVNTAALANYNSITVNINLNGATLLGNDASALYLNQGSGWKYISLSSYVQQGLNGWQTVTIPLSAFSGFDKTQSFYTLGFRFWVNNASTIDIGTILFNP